MSPRILGSGMFALAALSLAVPTAAQTRSVTARAPAAAPSREEARTMLAELQGITQRLQAAHNRAMQDATLRTTQQALARDLKAAMERLDPELPALAQRVRQMEADARTAQARGDAARIQTLTREFVAIRQRFTRVQTQVMQQPALAGRARAFDAALHRQMVAAEPQTDRLLARSRELQERLRAAAVAARQAPQQAPRRTP